MTSAFAERLAEPSTDDGPAQTGRRAAAVARVDLELLSRELGVTAAEFSARWTPSWPQAKLKARPADERDVEIGRLKARSAN
jgi:hypothetical protein